MYRILSLKKTVCNEKYKDNCGILLAFAELQFSEREQSERGLVTQEEYSRFVATWRLEGFFGYENSDCFFV